MFLIILNVSLIGCYKVDVGGDGIKAIEVCHGSGSLGNRLRQKSAFRRFVR